LEKFFVFLPLVLEIVLRLLDLDQELDPCLRRMEMEDLVLQTLQGQDRHDES